MIHLQPLHNPHFIKFIVYFNENQDFFECHEELEEYWKSLPNRTKDHPLTAYILLSTGLYHWRRGNLVGGHRSMKKAYMKLLNVLQLYEDFTQGIDFNQLCQSTKKAIQQIERSENFTPFKIVITSTEIRSLTEKMRTDIELLPIQSDAIIHKHMRRDRSSILNERNKKREEKRRTDD